jgi:TRAP-type uncharacterized transport system substrate-binding protein
MKASKLLLFVLLIALVGGCSARKKGFNIAVSPDKKSPEYRRINSLTEAYNRFSENKVKFNLHTGPDYTFDKNVTHLVEKKSTDDFAIIYNDIYNANDERIDKIKGIRTIFPISSKFLYIIHKRNLVFNNIAELFEGRRVAILSYDKKMIMGILNDFGVDTSKVNAIKTQYDYSLLDTNIKIDSLDFNNNYSKLDEMPYDIEVSFNPVNFSSRARLNKFFKKHDDFRFFSIDDYRLFKQGSFVDGFCQKNKFYSPYILPKGLYGSEPEEPILTIRQDLVLIGKASLEEEVVFDFVKYAFEKSGRIDMKLYGAALDNINPAFPYHEGTLIYLNKAEPTFIERYGEKSIKIAGGIAAFSTLITSFLLWRKKRRRKHMNKHYIQLLDYKEKLYKTNNRTTLDEYYAEIREIQMDLASQIQDERIIVDENITIINNLILSLEDYYYNKIDNLKEEND